MSKLIKRKDGSYSKRGLWDNIRANKGSGKEPTKEMLKQESKIKKEESMNSMYKKGGKSFKKPMKRESFMEESKEIHFDAPGVKPPKKFAMGGKNGDPRKATSVSPTSAEPKPLTPEQRAAIEEMKNLRKPSKDYKLNPSDAKKKYEEGGRKKYPSDDSDSRNSSRGRDELLTGTPKRRVDITYETLKDEDGYPLSMSNRTKTVTKFKRGAEGMESEVVKSKTRRVSDTSAGGKGTNLTYSGPGQQRTGGKSMAPGGGGRFEALVNKLKSKGKSEEAAEGIAASAGRAKYGKGKFQAMAAAGKKKMMMGGKKC